MLSNDFFVSNRAKLLDSLEDRSLAIIFAGEKKVVSGDWLYPFSPNRNYYYLTGLDNHSGVIALVKSGSFTAEYLFVRRPEPRLELYKGKIKTTDEYALDTGFQNVKYLDEFTKTIGDLLNYNNFESLYIDYKKRTMDNASDETGCFIKTMHNSYPALNIKDIRLLLDSMRRIKTADELSMMQRACDFTTEGVKRTVRKIAPGVHTYELYAEFEYYLRRNALSTCAFESVITTGNDCLVIHCEYYGEIRDGDCVIVDVGAEYGYYASDICRVYPANGKFSQEQRYFYEAVIEAEETIIKALKPGFDMNDIGPIGDEILAKRCRDAGLLKSNDEIRNYLPHGIYHFIGLDSHDVGEKCVLQPGMVVSIEPGLYIKQFGLAVRVEDNILITESGNVNMTQKIPKTPDEIESEMEEK